MPMKKPIALILSLCLLLTPILPALAAEMSELNATDAFSAKVKRVMTIMPPSDYATHRYCVQQGAATDGTYAYFVLENQDQGLGSIWKVSLADWRVVDCAFELPIDHGNDMTYNPNTGLLVVVHNKPNYDTISMVDPQTLTVVDSRVLPYRMYGIAYSAERDQYAIGLSGSYDMVILDGEFNEVARYSGVDSGLVRQGMDCDENFIYFAQNSEDDLVNVIMAYDWSGQFVTQVKVKNMQEIEAMFHVGSDYYLAFHSGGTYLYRITLNRE